SSIEEILLPEQQRGPELIVGVLLLGEAMPLVGTYEMPRGPAVLAHRCDDLLGFGCRHARIIGARYDKERLADVADARERRDFRELCALLGDALVAIFDAAQVAAVILGVFKKGNKVRDRDDAQIGAQPVGIMNGSSIAHIAAVTAPGQAEASRIERRILRQHIKERPYVLDAVFALEGSIVEADERLAIAWGSTDVGIEVGDAKFIKQIIVAPEKPGP